MKISKETKIQLYKNIVRGREFELMLRDLSLSNKLAGWAHLGLGQESTGSALAMLMKPEDYLIPYHRSRITIIGRGMPPELFLGEMMGRKIGACGGTGGEGHSMSPEYNYFITTSLIGNQVPVAAGLAYAAKLEGKQRIAVCHFGEGTTARGPWHESINMAAVFDLPLVFICENNLYAEFSPQSVEMKVKNVADRAVAYGIPGEIIDGNNPLEAYEVISKAVQRARAGQGPTLIEAKTYRHSGHYEGDMCTYRAPGELEQWLERDPTITYRKRLLDEGLAAEAELDAYVKEAKDEMEKLADYVYHSPATEKEDLFRPIYA